MAASGGVGVGIDRAYPVSATSVATNEATRTKRCRRRARHGQINLPRGGWFDQIGEVSATLPIERRRLGRSELTIPRVALGCGNFGGVGSAPELFGQGLSQDEAFELMDAAWEQGIDHFDTADAYGGGRSERMIGAWMRSRGVRPLLTTKTYNPMDAGADHGLAPERVERQLESSLERLGVERVDLYLAHDFDFDVPLGETFAAIERQVDAGKVAAYGVSNFDADQLAAALAAGAPAAIQNERSLLARGDEEGLLPLCRRERVSYLAFSPLGGGWLTGKYRRGEPFPAGSRMTQRPEPYAGLARRAASTTGSRRSRSSRSSARHRWPGPRWPGCWPMTTSPRSSSGRAAAEHLAPVREALERPLSTDERVYLDSVFT